MWQRGVRRRGRELPLRGPVLSSRDVRASVRTTPCVNTASQNARQRISSHPATHSRGGMCYIQTGDCPYAWLLTFHPKLYQVAQLYSVAEASKNETGGGEGVEVLKNEPFDNHPLLGNRFSSGQYTYKIYHLKSKVPAFIRLLAPEGSLEVHEEAWNAYPYCRTIISNPGYMKEGFYISIETLHAPGDGDMENAHELSGEKLKIREVVPIDISNDAVKTADYKPDEDPTKFKSVKTGRGPLQGPEWWKKCDPVMTCYKLVTCEFKWFGLQTRVEKFIQDIERRLFTNFHRQVFCWMDRWHGMTMEDIRRLEDKTKQELDKQRKVGEVRGTRSE
ncbi:phosphatidylinositol transfer protein beta isoform isoform X5 [Procambarus clarkii]|uniref:phosphatidylinositol transfer protein beta isoform isoform X5 n=1 Tax=Procambarus clarkii TaxID=6728 RepID=UPI001E6714CF|nr:phosphatidylinositol transfer protein beta isoform-like isoform X4 [Procambarus clarkii]